MSGGARKGTSIKGQAAARRQGLWSRTELPIRRPPLPQLWTPTRWEDLALEELASSFSFLCWHHVPKPDWSITACLMRRAGGRV